MKNKNKFIYWTPRVLGILFVLFLMTFSLDVFDGNYSFWGTVVGLFMHNIPAIILVILLWISWKYEIVGAIAFIGAGLFYVGMILFDAFTSEGYLRFYMITYLSIIAGPSFLVGILFWLGWAGKKVK
ncbi:MAG: hypothetical protein WC702_00790 [Patescibacteria group bacterium]|jgi:hypothetical protein